MSDVAEQSAGIEEEPLFHEALARFGAKQTMPDVETHLRSARAVGEIRGTLQRRGTTVVPC